MTNYEESAKAFENDYKFAPVGMGVGSFWGGALAAGLVTLLMNIGVAKGWWGTTIRGGERTLFTDDAKALYLGIAFAIVLLVISILIGFTAHSLAIKKKDLAGLWKLSLTVVPVLAGIGVLVAIVALH